MVEPTRLPCKHTFCVQCIKQFFLEKRECPMCRQLVDEKTKIELSQSLAKQIKKERPKSFEARHKQLDKDCQLMGNQKEVKFYFGNKHEAVKDAKTTRSGFVNKHKWTMFIKTVDPKKDGPASNYISKVRYGLHPSFGMDYMDIKYTTDNPNFEMTFSGFGEFMIPVTMHLKRLG